MVLKINSKKIEEDKSSFMFELNSTTNRTHQMIEKTLFGVHTSGEEVYLYSLKNKWGTQIDIINYGAIVKNLFVSDKNGEIADVVLGYDSLEEYINDNSYFGGIVGRYGNRIAKGKFRLNGKEYQLAINDGENHLHGGPGGFNKVLWKAEFFQGKAGSSLKLTYVSLDGEEGYPGTLKLSVIYTLTERNEIIINYEGKTDKPTILNPTHHSYFNLSGDFTKTILEHELRINADTFTSDDGTRIPTGEFTNVKDTPWDFLVQRPIGLNINENNEQLKSAKGYDHNWVLNSYNSTIRSVASLFEPITGRFMEVITDQPGLQFYSGNFLNRIKGKNGITYESRTGLCLETQHFPDSPNKPHFPSVVLKPGETYKQTTIYKFSVK
jgi:aldose 1-epimerase